MENPVDGLVPDFSIFGGEFTQWWQKLYVALLAIVIVILIANLVIGILRMGAANTGGHPQQQAEARQGAVQAVIALILVASVGTLVGAIFVIVG